MSKTVLKPSEIVMLLRKYPPSTKPFDELNDLEKAVYVQGGAIRATVELLDLLGQRLTAPPAARRGGAATSHAEVEVGASDIDPEIMEKIKRGEPVPEDVAKAVMDAAIAAGEADAPPPAPSGGGEESKEPAAAEAPIAAAPAPARNGERSAPAGAKKPAAKPRPVEESK